MNRGSLNSEPIDSVLTYNGVDARYHRLAWIELNNRIQDEGLIDLYLHHMQRLPTCVLTQLRGVPINQETRKVLSKKYAIRRKRAEDDIQGLPIVKKFAKKTGQIFRPSANEDVIAAFRSLGVQLDNTDQNTLNEIDHPLAKAMLTYRKAAKVESTYLNPVAPGAPYLFPDGKLHPILTHAKTRTWRTSSEDINIQNWPKRNDEAKEVRKVVGKRGLKVVSFDYGQIQARNVGMESKDAALVKAFWDRYDIHQDWTERIIKLYPQWITEGVKQVANDKTLMKSYRNRTKNEFVFPSFFGAQPPTLAGYLGVPEDVAKKLVRHFWEMFPNVHDWQEGLKKFYRKYGYVTGCTGFRRR
ncbi:MAG: DNA polymerase, partial [Anaerolineae bacterium]|nr:DNA polymerase [Anaerolineae bacterium]